MSAAICLAAARTIMYPHGGGHLWVYLQWALSLLALGWRVIWLEGLNPRDAAGRRGRAPPGPAPGRLDGRAGGRGRREGPRGARRRDRRGRRPRAEPLGRTPARRKQRQKRE